MRTVSLVATRPGMNKQRCPLASVQRRKGNRIMQLRTAVLPQVPRYGYMQANGFSTAGLKEQPARATRTI